jgi:hypothetical protein
VGHFQLESVGQHEPDSVGHDKLDLVGQYAWILQAMEHSVVLMYVLLFFSLFSKRSTKERFLLKPYCIISFGFLIYFSVTFMVFLDANYYIELNNFFNWSVHSVLNIFLNMIYFSALWVGGKMSRID